MQATADTNSSSSQDIASRSVLDIVSSLKPNQLWTLLATLAGLIAGSFALGGYITSARTDILVAKKETEVSEAKRQGEELVGKKTSEIGELKKQVTVLDDAKTSMKVALENVKQIVDAQMNQIKYLELKSEFLNRYYSYVTSDEDPTQIKLFADFVCVLWHRAQAENLGITTDRTPIVTTEGLRRGVSQSIREELVKHGIDVEQILSQLRNIDGRLEKSAQRVGPFRQPNPNNEIARRDARKEEAELNERLRKAGTRKVVTFSGVLYDVPPLVSEVVHNRPDCAPKPNN